MPQNEIAPIATGATVVASIAEAAAVTGLHIPPAARGIVGRHAKTMLDDGMRPDLVTAACYMAILRGRPEVAQYIALDLSLREAGMEMTPKEYEEKLALYSAGGAGRRRLLEEQQQRLSRRELEIERRRNGEA